MLADGGRRYYAALLARFMEMNEAKSFGDQGSGELQGRSNRPCSARVRERVVGITPDAPA